MTTPQPQWRKSSYSNMTDQGECIETADLGGGLRGIRDSKNPSQGHLTVPVRVLASLLDVAKAQ